MSFHVLIAFTGICVKTKQVKMLHVKTQGGEIYLPSLQFGPSLLQSKVEDRDVLLSRETGRRLSRMFGTKEKLFSPRNPLLLRLNDSTLLLHLPYTTNDNVRILGSRGVSWVNNVNKYANSLLLENGEMTDLICKWLCVWYLLLAILLGFSHAFYALLMLVPGSFLLNRLHYSLFQQKNTSRAWVQSVELKKLEWVPIICDENYNVSSSVDNNFAPNVERQHSSWLLSPFQSLLNSLKNAN